MKGKKLMAAGKTADACSAFVASQKLDPAARHRVQPGALLREDGQAGVGLGRLHRARRQGHQPRPPRRQRPAGQAPRAAPHQDAHQGRAAGARPERSPRTAPTSPCSSGSRPPSTPAPTSSRRRRRATSTWTDRIALRGEGKTHLGRDAGARPAATRAAPQTPPTSAAAGRRQSPLRPRRADGRRRGPRRRRHRAGRAATSASARRGRLVAVGVGLWFGLQASDLNGDAEDLCGGAIDMCDPANLDEAQSKVDDARTKATASTSRSASGSPPSPAASSSTSPRPGRPAPSTRG